MPFRQRNHNEGLGGYKSMQKSASYQSMFGSLMFEMDDNLDSKKRVLPSITNDILASRILP